ncbi:MAG: DUF2125 domain-containing protein [Pseudolabrys sp.]|nr:DUF2125 domain-containing protein [Pseudolabrys sp.]MSP31638.1 DUF2125 domain-containing protein [Pseudolabrys sp.]
MATDRIGRWRNRRYISLVILVAALFGGWSWLWSYASGKAEATIDGWRAREAKAGRIYTCGSQTISGYPFRIEVNCNRASALFRSNQPPVEIKSRGILIAAQIYQPTLLISEFHGPLTIADPGQPPNIVVNWKLAQSSVRGTPAAPERVSLVFDKPVVDRMSGGSQQHLLVAKHIEIHGRMVEGSAANKPVIEIALQLEQASAPFIHPAAEKPVDADIVAVLRGLNDFSPKPWPARFREIQAAGGRIDITQARMQQGESIAVGGGSLSLNANGRLDGQLRVTVAGVESFLNSIGAQQMVQASPGMDKLAGALDRLAPGLGNVARQQAGANISLGINLLGQQTTLEGKQAVSLPLRFDDGAIFLGPIRIGNAPALF